MRLRLHHFGRSSLLTALAGLLPLVFTCSILAHGGYHERISELTAQSKANPSDPALYFKLGNLHGLHGDVELALKNLDRADELAPGKFPTDLLRGEALLIAEEFARAKEALDRHVAAHPEAARGWLLRARAERHLAQHETSLRHYREALKRTTSPDPDIVQEVAGALAAQGQTDEAAQVLAAGIEKLGNIPSLVLRVVELEVETKKFDAALQRIEQAQQGAPRREPWMARRATVLAQAGRTDESRAAWKALLDHLESLTERERNSRAMSNLAKEAREALAALESSSAIAAQGKR